MVDRITPVTAEADIAALAERYGVVDRWPVFAEAFTQWVIEDRFPAGRPAWEEVGAQFVDRRRALRVHEAAAAQCQPPRGRRRGPAGRLRHDRRGDGRSADRPVHGAR